jgi:hypothetical protein
MIADARGFVAKRMLPDTHQCDYVLMGTTCCRSRPPRSATR